MPGTIGRFCFGWLHLANLHQNMNQYKLPQELIDIIINYLLYDSRALHQCARVCGSWLPKARRNIFHQVAPNGRYNRRSDAIYIPYSKQLDRVLLKLPHIAEYLRELEVYVGQELKYQNWITTDHTSPPPAQALTKIKLRRLTWNEVPLDLR